MINITYVSQTDASKFNTLQTSSGSGVSQPVNYQFGKVPVIVTEQKTEEDCISLETEKEFYKKAFAS